MKLSLANLFLKLSAERAARPRTQRPGTPRLRVETLEDRLAPAGTFLVQPGDVAVNPQPLPPSGGVASVSLNFHPVAIDIQS